MTPDELANYCSVIPKFTNDQLNAECAKYIMGWWRPNDDYRRSWFNGDGNYIRARTWSPATREADALECAQMLGIDVTDYASPRARAEACLRAAMREEEK